MVLTFKQHTVHFLWTESYIIQKKVMKYVDEDRIDTKIL